MSHLPLPEQCLTQDDSRENVCALEENQLQSLPIQASDIRVATSKDRMFTVRRWPNTVHSIQEKVKRFFSKRLQLSVTNGHFTVRTKGYSFEKQFYVYCMKVIREEPNKIFDYMSGGPPYMMT